jgi:hypothetical protein
MRSWLPVRAAVLGALYLALLAAVSATFAAPAARNLLGNPGFAAPLAGHDWMPASWDTSESGLPTVFFGRDTFSAHTGEYSISVANLSTLYPMWHNWNQSLVVGREAWGKDAVFSIWTRSNGLQGRAYVMLQAYRDTISKMAKVWGVDRDDAARRMEINKVDDPLISFGWSRRYFDEPETGWVKREVRVHVAPSTNMLFVRCGVFGTGQVMFDDASLTLEPARPAPPPRPGENLLVDGDFEGDGHAWEWVMLPYEGHRVWTDTTVAHGGRASMTAEGGMAGMVSARAGVAQAIDHRGLAGKRVRLSGWVKTDSLKSLAALLLYAHTVSRGMVKDAVPTQYSMNTDWTYTSIEADLPWDTYQVWAWLQYTAPATGRVWWDDAKLEVIGESSQPKPRPGAARSSAARSGR